MPNHYATAEDIRELRESRGLTQREAAELCGVDERTYQRWEASDVKRGVRTVYLDRIRRSKRAVMEACR